MKGASNEPHDDLPARQSSKYSASPQYGWFGSAPSSFEVVNRLVVTVDEAPEFQRVAELADQNDAIRFGGVDFEHSQKQAYEDKVREKAVDAVLEERRYFEQKLGLALRPVTFTTDAARELPYEIEEIVVTGARIGSSKSAEYVPSPTFDEIEYRASVSVTFEIAPPDP